jgi:hypothetical protein
MFVFINSTINLRKNIFCKTQKYKITVPIYLRTKNYFFNLVCKFDKIIRVRFAVAKELSGARIPSKTKQNVVR